MPDPSQGNFVNFSICVMQRRIQLRRQHDAGLFQHGGTNIHFLNKSWTLLFNRSVTLQLKHRGKCVRIRFCLNLNRVDPSFTLLCQGKSSKSTAINPLSAHTTKCGRSINPSFEMSIRRCFRTSSVPLQVFNSGEVSLGFDRQEKCEQTHFNLHGVRKGFRLPLGQDSSS